jgi:hypothetical protein
MPNNKATKLEISGDDRSIVRLRKRHYRRYRQLAHRGGWRALAQELCPGLNVAYVYNFVAHGNVPPNLEARAALGIRVPKAAKPLPEWASRAAEFLSQRDLGSGPGPRVYSRKGRRLNSGTRSERQP